MASTSTAAATAHTAAFLPASANDEIKAFDKEYDFKSFENKQIVYPQYHSGPYYVVLRSESQISTRSRNRELHRFEKLSRITNDFVNNTRLNEMGLTASIPNRFV